MNPPCPVDEYGFCSRHGITHIGHTLKYATGTDEKSQRMRQAWDAARGLGPHPTPRPSIKTQLGTAVRAMFRAGSTILMGGQAFVPDEVRQARQEECNQCPHWKHGRCELCGCFTNLKLRLASEECPDQPPRWKRWEAGQPEFTTVQDNRTPRIALEGPVRHLLYHVYPVQNGIWEWNVDQLRSRLKLFNGRRVVAVVTDARTVDPDQVRARLGEEVEYLIGANNPGLREVLTFGPLLERVQTYQGDQDYTFFGHAKGVTRPWNEGSSIPLWVQALYEINLDYWPLVQEQLLSHPIVGAFQKLGSGFAGSQSAWHYSGTFFWLRNKSLFARDWQKIDQSWWGVEAWPGLAFTQEEAGCLFKRDLVPALNLYDRGFWNDQLQNEYQAWRMLHASMRPSLSGT